MPLALKHWKLSHKLDYKDDRYKKVNEFVQNANRWERLKMMRSIKRANEQAMNEDNFYADDNEEAQPDLGYEAADVDMAE